MKKIITGFLFSALIAVMLLPATNVYAKGLVPCGGPSGPVCNVCYLLKTFSNVYNFILVKLTPPTAVILFVVGGIMYLTSGGSDDRLKKAKQLFWSTVIGLLIIYGSWLIINTVIITLGGNITGFSADTWYSFDCTIPNSI